ncbi:MAG TPA: extracellular solute-binding protein [Actinocrinis sp.]|jgi:multiple sugar transport system substrate-binding protein|uniref:extracellular solute-binding protein n=1 Tax=Actinocrinis sp. TaxID=1920516 RepID=UPI002DDCE93B|nr:extracellular solute-binding protein [Actinocrinis sp.]HEV3170655.1 extracellular solute-binding protein [Actinocrinis sp.]
MKRRLAAAAVIGLSASVTIAACGSSSPASSSGSGSGGKTTIKIVAADYGTGASNTSQTYWQNVASDFSKQNPNITVDVQTIDWNDLSSKVQTMVQNKQYPDILEGLTFAQYVQDGIAYKASDVLDSATLSNISPIFAKAGQVSGTEYGIPWTTSSRAFFYNKKLFTQAGITAAPTTWDQLKADALQIAQKTGKTGFGLPLGSEEAQAESLLWFLGNGGGLTDASGQYAINSAQNVATYQYLQGLVKAGATEPDPATKNRTDLWQQFAQGNIGMINGSPALIPIIQKAGVLADSDYGVVAVPGKTGPLTSTVGVADYVVALNTNSHQDAVKAFLDFAYNDTNQLAFDNEYDLLPATTSASNTMAQNPLFAGFLKNLPTATLYPSAQANWSTVLTAIQKQIGTAITGDPKTVLDQIQQTATSGQ